MPSQDQSLDDEMQFSTHVSDFFESREYPVKCFKPLNESVRVWFQSDDHIIVWSCREENVQDILITYDAALIYGVPEREFPTNNSMFEKLVLKFKSLESDYFQGESQGLVKWPEKWPIISDRKTMNNSLDYMYCQKENVTDSTPNPIYEHLTDYVLLLVVILIFGGLLVKYLWIYLRLD